MRIKGTRIVKLADLHTNLFVRKVLDQSHALYLGELIENGTEMTDMIEVTEREGLLEIVDGRHRKEGYDLAGILEKEVKVLKFDSEAELIAYAYRANTGGSKPPTKSDTEHTVELLLLRNESMKAIGEMLGLPTNLARQYCNTVKSRMARVRLQRAATAVTGEENLSIKVASEKYGVEDPEKLKEMLSGRHTKHKYSGVAELQRTTTKLYHSLGLKNASALKKLIEKYEDGDVNEKQVKEMFKHLENLQKKSSRVTADWKTRFEAKVTETNVVGK